MTAKRELAKKTDSIKEKDRILFNYYDRRTGKVSVAEEGSFT